MYGVNISVQKWYALVTIVPLYSMRKYNKPLGLHKNICTVLIFPSIVALHSGIMPH